MSTTSEMFKRELIELALEARSEILSEFSLPEGDQCELCGDKEFQIELLNYDCKARLYTADCRSSRCDGQVAFYRLSVQVGEGFPFTSDRYAAVSCTEGCSPREITLHDIWPNTKPRVTERYTIPMQAIATNRICVHHTSYEPEETMYVCESCHAKIHHNDGFRPDLQPDMKREEWVADDD